MEGSDPAFGSVAESGLSRFELGFECRHGDVFCHQVHGGILQDPCRFPGLGVLENFASLRRQGSRADPGDPQGQAVHQDHVAVVAVDADGVIRRHAVDPLAPRQLRGFELLLVPIAIQYPLALLQFPGLLRDPGDEILLAPRFPELEAEERKTAVKEMGMAVDETGKRRAAPQVDHPGLRAGQTPDLPAGPDKKNPLAFDGDRFGPRQTLLARPDDSVEKDQVSHFSHSGTSRHPDDGGQQPRGGHQ